MPAGAITMILANVGMQIFNNWCGSRQNKAIQQKQEEFESASRERNTQRMWQLMREGQELTRQLEEEKHQQRMEELKNDIGSLLHKLTYAATINNWPLNVLPIVMKNQALGNLLANQEESIALHCIFTPSNSLEFNRTIFPRIEEAMEAYCNQHWSVMSEHPILFYSGAWKSQQAPTEVQIDSMRTALSNLPTLVLTPFFRPNDGKLVFHVRLWGVGASSSDEFSIPEIEPTNFQRNYQAADDYVTDSAIADELLEDIVPYLQCLIGYMADTYFWSSLGKAPHLPLLLTDGTINTDGMKYLISDSREYYEQLLVSSEEDAKNATLTQNNLWPLYDGGITIWDKDTQLSNLLRIVALYNGAILSDSKKTLEGALINKEYCSQDLKFLKTIERYKFLLSPKLRGMLDSEIHRLSHLKPTTFPRRSFPDHLLQEVMIEELDMEEILNCFTAYCTDMRIENQSLLICCISIHEYQFHTYDEKNDMILYYDVPFNLRYITQKVKHQRNVNSLFSKNTAKQLSCRQSRIGYLIEKLNDTSLIY